MDKALETGQNNPMLPAKTSVGPNYDLRSQVAYQIGPHWFAGGFLGANNTRNYIHLCWVLRPVHVPRAALHGDRAYRIFPTDGLRPFTVP